MCFNSMDYVLSLFILGQRWAFGFRGNEVISLSWETKLEPNGVEASGTSVIESTGRK